VKKHIIPFILAFAAVISFSVAQAQSSGPTKGKEFWVGFMQNFEVQIGAEELSFFITSSQNTTGTIEVPLQGYEETFNVTANQTTTVTIPNDLVEHFTSEVVENKGIFISTADTVSVFAINFNDFTADATKILPIQSLGIDYMVSSYGSGFANYGSECLIVATEDDTEIEIIPSAQTSGGNAPGVPFIVQLDRGESYQIQVNESFQDLTGTIIRGTEVSGECRPFAVFSGTSCVNIPDQCTACDHIFEQNFPVGTWGNEFHLVPFQFSESCTYRVLANQDNTQVFEDGVLTNTLNAGEFYEVNFLEEPRCITSDQPINVTQYMEGVTCTGAGDPAMLILNDATQKIDEITFSTVNVNVITEHGLTVIVNTADINSVVFDGALLDPTIFEPMPSCVGHSYARFPVAEGSHNLSAENGVTAYIYGTGEAESYAYSVGSFTPTPPLIIDEVLCTSDEVNLAAENGLIDVEWYILSNPDSIIATGPQLTLTPPIISDVYVAVGNQFQSGCESEEFFSVEAPDPPELVLSQSEEEICQYEQVQLGVEAIPSGTYTYSWTPVIGLNNPNSANPVATPLQTTTYTVEVTTLSGCAFATGEVTIDVLNTGGVANFEATSDIEGYCGQGEAQLEVTFEEPVFQDNFDPGVSWGLWEDIQNGEDDVACGLTSGNGLWFNGPGNRYATTSAIDVSAGGAVSFTIAIGSGVFPCDDVEPGEDIVLEYSTAGPGGPFTIMDVLPQNQFAAPTTVEVPIPAGAQTAATHFRWRQLANGGDGEDNWILDDIFVGVVNTGGYTVEWSPALGLDDDESFTPIASPDITTTYEVLMIDDLTGCEYTDEVTILVEDGFNLDLTPDAAVCETDGFELQALPDEPGDYTWSWSNPGLLDDEDTGTPTINQDVSNTYTVTVTSSTGCTLTEEITVELVFESFDLGEDQDLCDGESLVIESGFDATLGHEWTTSSTATSIEVTDGGTYGVTITSPDGCTISDEIEVTLLPSPVIDLADDPQLCEGSTFILDAGNPGADYLWNTEAATQTISVTESGFYEVTVTLANGCVESSGVDLQFDPVPTAELPDEDGACEGEEIILDAGNPGATFIWSNNATEQSIVVTEPGTYQVTITNEFQCSIDDQIDIVFEAQPEPNLGEDAMYCVGETVELDPGTAGYNHLWSTGETEQVITVGSTGTYTVSVTGDYCSAEDAISLLFNPLPVDNLPADTLLCLDEPPYELLLDAGNPGATYLWNLGSAEQTVAITEEGYYTVSVTTPLGCNLEFDIVVSDQCFGDYLYVPNAITPNNDGINDAFRAEGTNIAEFEMEIWNRWGEKIWSSTDITESWVGNHDRDGEYYVENEVYLYVVRYKYFTDVSGSVSETIEKTGTVTIIR
jgi:gliding motility-associated-like protein